MQTKHKGGRLGLGVHIANISPAERARHAVADFIILAGLAAAVALIFLSVFGASL